jgi:L-ornithine N5-oxygenase
MTQRRRIEATDNSHPDAVLDVVGVGFGPANLSLALCLQEQPCTALGRPMRSLFLEQKSSYDWHPDMLLAGAEIQVPFFKDLVTLRNPQSRFTFLNYLHQHGRLLDFVNLRSFFPTRREFNHYYQWVAAQLAEQARYGREVLAVSAVADDDGPVDLLRVVARHLASGRQEEYLTRNLVLATGGVPHIPPGIDIATTEKVFHSQSFLQQVRRHFPDPAARYRFVVVGSGQSAAEIFQYLFTNYPRAEVTATMRRFAYKPADESEFVNEIYSPLMTDTFFSLPDAERRGLIAAHADTNYSAVDVELIRSIFRALYEMKVAGDTRARVRSLVELRQLEPHHGAIQLKLWDKVAARLETLEVDGVVLATGFQRPRRHPLLRDLSQYLLTTVDGEYQVTRDYRARSVETFNPKIFLQGFCETTHGLPDTVLSVLPARSWEIAQALTADGAAGAAGAALGDEGITAVAAEDREPAALVAYQQSGGPR